MIDETIAPVAWPVTWIDQGSATTPRGWRAAAVACGMRYSQRADLALLVSDTPCAAAALFTTNRVKSAHILYDQPVLARNPTHIQAVLINTGSANTCTGSAGMAAAAQSAQEVERVLGLPAESSLVMSTGVIGVPLRLERLLPGIQTAAAQLDVTNGTAAAAAIMTTDTYAKHCALSVELPSGGTITLGGMAKGCGMIHPNMATMLGVLTTDAAVSPPVLDQALRFVTHRSFHCISIDGDTSTNDTLLVMANGHADTTPIDSLDTPDGQAFLAGLLEISRYLAREVVRDGEGATRFTTIQVRGATSDADAHRAAMTIARSPLVKTALFGADPNWGRVLCALGYSGAQLIPDQVELFFGPIKVFAEGAPLDFDEQEAHQLLDQPEVTIHINLGLGDGSATAWTSDLSYEYVRINAEYRS